MHNLNFLNEDIIKEIEDNYKLPVYVYSEQKLLEAANKFKDFPSAFGHTVRYAMKANSNINILKIFKNEGLKIDASSVYEVKRALNAGFIGRDIQLSGQELPEDLGEVIDLGVFFVATSLKQIAQVGDLRPGTEIGIRINPGVGDGAFKAISTGGATSSFGIWYEYIPTIKKLVLKYGLKVSKIHIHIGSENTPESWVNTTNIGLDFVREFETVTCLNMGGGFKKAIMPYESDADLQEIGKAVKAKVKQFYEDTSREIKLELEPGKYMVINSCSVIGKVIDVVDTGEMGYRFIRTNTGMTEMPRVTMYGIQQPIIVINNKKETKKYVVVGHCCESGDILTSKLYNQEEIEPVMLKHASVGDTIVFEGTGAYNSSMSMKNYNSFPEVGELLLRMDGSIVKIRKRAKDEEVWRNEIDIIN